MSDEQGTEVDVLGQKVQFRRIEFAWPNIFAKAEVVIACGPNTSDEEGDQMARSILRDCIISIPVEGK